MDVYFQSYVVGCEFIFVIFFNSRNKICHKKEREVMMQWQNVKVCPGEVFIFVARPQMSYLANCHYFKKLIFPSASPDGMYPFWTMLKKHCTIGYAMKIKKKKMFKSKHLVFTHFSTKTGDFFGIDGKIPMFCHKYFWSQKCDFFWWFWPKN